jgi:hypothetical protein
MQSKNLKAPFPYFGGKSQIADVVWNALGQPAHYIEPFFGSGAVLLRRPNFNPAVHTETICDKDGFVANVWRSIQYSPDETAKWCDWPVNHADLCARRKVLIKNEDRLLENLIADDMWHDPKMAGYWIWAASCWIGSGLTRPTAGPSIAHKGEGVHAIGQHSKIPYLMGDSKGIHTIGKRPVLSYGFTGDGGVHNIGTLPQLSSGYSEGGGIHRNVNIYDWFQSLSNRLRRVRVVCGDWSRVCGGNWQASRGICGIFFDPPYGVKDRDVGVYGKHDSIDIAAKVADWAITRADNPNYRIVIAGYEEHRRLIELGWTAKTYKGVKGYQADGNNNRHRETLYFSPHCITQKQETLL